MTIHNFDEALYELQRFVPPPFSSRDVYSLDRIAAFMDFLGNPQDTMQVIHVAGTSGKTSTSYYCAALLQAAGKHVGLTVSPHIMALNERVQIDGTPLEEATFCADLGEFLELANESGIMLTYFELLVAFAYWEFAKHKVEFAVVEVGLGGLMDGTNTVHNPAKVCVITDIGLDHVHVLGNTIAEIASQKAGIIQSGNHVFMYKQADEVMQTVQDRLDLKKGTLNIVERAEHAVELPDFQLRNFNLAYQVVQSFLPSGLTDDEIHTASATLIPGRFEVFTHGASTIILDGAHNPQKMEALTASLRHQYPERRPAVAIAFADGSNERYGPAMQAITTLTDHVVLTSFQASQDAHKSNVPAETLLAVLQQQAYTGDVEVEADPIKAIKRLEAAGEPMILVTGSFYMLGPIRQWLQEETAQ
ncbi:MAG: hypothetical protein JWM37_483 [Candidatus Saccharibacteria bacterium]|nr:hypothetical protein [Candidatus Saccharibacteria bacterium]